MVVKMKNDVTKITVRMRILNYSKVMTIKRLKYPNKDFRAVVVQATKVWSSKISLVVE